jgi:hypothetical protein
MALRRFVQAHAQGQPIVKEKVDPIAHCAARMRTHAMVVALANAQATTHGHAAHRAPLAPHLLREHQSWPVPHSIYRPGLVFFQKMVSFR